MNQKVTSLVLGEKVVLNNQYFTLPCFDARTQIVLILPRPFFEIYMSFNKFENFYDVFRVYRNGTLG